MSSKLFEQPSFIPAFDDFADFKGQRIGLTGQRGVLGGILYDRLSKHGIHVNSYPEDITDVRFLSEWFRKHHFDYFFNLAAIVPVSRVEENPLSAYEVNAIGVYNICKQIIETQAKCWLFLASSSHVYNPIPIVLGEQRLGVGDKTAPNTFYGVTKLVGEQISAPILEKCGISYCIGRIFSYSNIAQKEPYLVPTLMRKIKELPENGILDLINPDSVRDIMDAKTVIDCILHLARKRFKGTLDIGSGKGVSVADLAKGIAAKLGKEIQIQGINKSLPNSLVADIEDLQRILMKSV